MSDLGARDRAFARIFRANDSTQYYHGLGQNNVPLHGRPSAPSRDGSQHAIDQLSDVTVNDSLDTFETDQVLNKVDQIALQQRRTHTHVQVLHKEHERDKKVKRDWYP